MQDTINKAQKIIRLDSITELKNHVSGMLLKIATKHCEMNGYYAYVKNGKTTIIVINDLI